MAHQPFPRKSLPQPTDTTALPQSRLIPEPVEISTRSNRAPPSKERNPDAVSAGVNRFLPQPIETSTTNSKNAGKGENPHNAAGAASAADLTSPQARSTHPIESHPASSKPRKFAPQLVETTRRRRKSTDIGPTVLPSDKTEVSPGDQSRAFGPPRPTRPSAFPTAPGNTPIVSTDRIPESRFSSSNLRKRTEPRPHSFRVPTLPPIQSTGNSGVANEPNCPSFSSSPSAASDETEPSKNARRVRRSCHEISTGYLLSQAAQAAEKQLREQAMAAYPNENRHEPVDHFAVDREIDDQEEEEEEMESLSRDTLKASEDASYAKRDDSATGWDLAEIRRHRETLEQQRNKRHTTVQPELDRRRSIKGPFPDPTQGVKNLQQVSGAARHNRGGRQKDTEMEKMRNAANPPMAGEKLRLPMCQSPRQTRLDVGHHPSALRNTGVATPKQHTGLWTPGGGASKRASVAGLWMGTSAKPAQSTVELPKSLQTGLLTPETEQDDPFASTSTSYDKHELPPSPPSSQSDSKISRLDSILQTEEIIAREFHDAFVTQVYNYLSLGYPSLARKFDVELSKISKTPIEELQQDDLNTDAKGYVGAPEGSGSDVRGVQQGACTRWSALRKYVREWARQQSHMRPGVEGPNGEWGHRARRGSWAI
ncbi:hypothetical protein MMC07_004716 [Pseudocyphellaria aurata]|nr:hypothetical protein [Pseudocyphellaria aurata]